jgi:DNA invertase Pin-like site-specific DNA recombinase
MDRPEFEKLMADVRSGRVSRVACWKLDRLGRTALGLHRLLAELRELGVDLVSLRDGFDLNTTAGRMVYGILASVAEYEKEVRQERQTIGIARAKAEGRKWGGRKVGAIVKCTPDRVQAVRKLSGEGMPITSIAAVTGLSRPTIYKVLGKA